MTILEKAAKKIGKPVNSITVQLIVSKKNGCQEDSHVAFWIDSGSWSGDECQCVEIKAGDLFISAVDLGLEIACQTPEKDV